MSRIWEYREIVWNLTVAEFKNRYQNTSLGFLWSILSPLLMTLVLYFVFARLFKEEENFAVNLLVGMVSWRFFALATKQCLYSVASKPSLVTKVYIPREILVLSVALAALVGSTLEFIVVLPIVFAIQKALPVTTLVFPLLQLIFLLLIYGIGLLLASFFVYFRDIDQIWDVLVQVLFFACPIAYPVSIVPDFIMPYYVLNPVTRMILAYQRVMVAGQLPALGSLLVIIGSAAIAYVTGSLVFNRLQRRFAEEL